MYIHISTIQYLISSDVAASVLKSICAKNCVSLLGYGLGTRDSSSAGSETELLESIRKIRIVMECDAERLLLE